MNSSVGNVPPGAGGHDSREFSYPERDKGRVHDERGSGPRRGGSPSNSRSRSNSSRRPRNHHNRRPNKFSDVRSRSRSRERHPNDRSDRDFRGYDNRPEGWRGPPPHSNDYGDRMRGPPPGFRDGPGPYDRPSDRRFPPEFRGNNMPPPPEAGPRFESRNGGGGKSRGRNGGDGTVGLSLLVRNVSADITTQDLHYAFSRIGQVRDVYIPRDYHSNQPKGFAFVEYATHEQAREAKEEMDKFVIKGKMIEVVFAQESRKSPHEMKGRGVNNNDGPSWGGSDDFGRSSSCDDTMRRERERQRDRNDGYRR